MAELNESPELLEQKKHLIKLHNRLKHLFLLYNALSLIDQTLIVIITNAIQMLKKIPIRFLLFLRKLTKNGD